MATHSAEKCSEAETEAIFRTVFAGILIVDAQQHTILDANAAALKLMGRAREDIIGHCCHKFVCPAEQGKCPITDLHTTVDSSERVLLDARGNPVPILKSVVQVERDGRACLLECFLDLTERKAVEEKLRQAQGELLQASRLAGMAEVATSVLHNVGNVLNSVNVSVDLLSNRVRKSKLASLSRAAKLMREHAKDLGTFITQDPKGQQLPHYLDQLAEYLVEEQESLLQELESLRANIEHIKDIVARQQSYARVAGVSEMVQPAELVEDALRINAIALDRHEVKVIRDYGPGQVPAITVDKHKVMQILVNLIRNAKYACDDSGRPDKQLTLRLSAQDARIVIAVRDNGIGIRPENLDRIFNHGFTTRKDGHGFGLHSAALAAKELGGKLGVESAGPGQGATFTLELPSAPPSAGG